jgi:catechol 2,3-dioxygenase-like lactoylglutathione lyase family enzyme
MQEEKVQQGTETEIRQIGVVVKDLDKTVQFLTALGLGPFTIRTATHPAARVRDKKTSYEVRIALSEQGPVQPELIEHGRGETIQKEFLDQQGEGLHHIFFMVNDLDKTLTRFKQNGLDALQEDRFVGGGGLAYMNTDKIGGIIMEIVQPPSEFDPEKGVQYRSSWNATDRK